MYSHVQEHIHMLKRAFFHSYNFSMLLFGQKSMKLPCQKHMGKRESEQEKVCACVSVSERKGGEERENWSERDEKGMEVK